LSTKWNALTLRLRSRRHALNIGTVPEHSLLTFRDSYPCTGRHIFQDFWKIE